MSHNGEVSGRSILSIAAGAAVGAIGWTMTEYTMHRWVLHGPLAKHNHKPVQVGSMHRAHHQDPEATSLGARILGHAAIAGVAISAAAGLSHIVPTGAARAAAAAWSAGYSAYEITHWNAHHRAPRTVWGERLRTRHMRHHYGAPKANLGVTMSWWDDLLGTEAPAAA